MAVQEAADMKDSKVWGFFRSEEIPQVIMVICPSDFSLRLFTAAAVSTKKMIIVLLHFTFKQSHHGSDGTAEEGQFVSSVRKCQMPDGTLDAGDLVVGRSAPAFMELSIQENITGQFPPRHLTGFSLYIPPNKTCEVSTVISRVFR